MGHAACSRAGGLLHGAAVARNSESPYNLVMTTCDVRSRRPSPRHTPRARAHVLGRAGGVTGRALQSSQIRHAAVAAGSIRPREGGGALEHYLAEIARLPLVSPGEQLVLAQRAAAGDGDARATLVQCNLRFVVRVAKQFANRGVALDELIAEGNLGLVHAVDRFRVEEGVNFLSYAIWWIRKGVQAAIAHHGHAVALPANRTASRSLLIALRAELRARWGREPLYQELARAARMDPESVVGILSTELPDVELDDGAVPTPAVISALMERKDVAGGPAWFTRESVARLLARLPSEDATVLRLCYGLDGAEPMSLDAVGQAVGRSREWARRHRDTALETLRTSGAMLADVA
jgi:RNA polymerase primary sigma factor